MASTHNRRKRGRLARLWAWVVSVVRDVGGERPMEIELERLPESGDAGQVQYVLRLGLRAGFDSAETARVPIFSRLNEAPHPILKEIHWCEVAGATLEAANVWALLEKVRRTLQSIAPGDSLPLCYFRVPTMDYSLPVYERGGRIICPVISGPKLKAADIAEMSRHVCRYLESAGYIGSDDEVDVGVVRPSDLKLVPPAAVVRSLDDSELWIPTIEGRTATGEEVVGVLGRSARLEAPERQRVGSPADTSPPAEPDIGSLLRYMGAELARAGRVGDAADVHAVKVRPEIWQRTEAATEDSGLRAACWLEDHDSERLELPLRRTAAGDHVVALSDRGIVVFTARNPQVIASALGRYLVAQEFLRWKEQVEVVPAGEPRAEGLKAEEIWTGFETDINEEVCTS